MPFKSKVEISQNFMAFLEYMKFTFSLISAWNVYRKISHNKEYCQTCEYATQNAEAGSE